MRERLFEALSKLVIRHNSLVLLVIVVITALSILGAIRIKIKTQFKDMLPENNPAVQSFDDVVKHFSSVSTVIVGIEGEDTDEMELFAEDLASAFKDYPEYVRRVDYRLDIDFFKHHMMMIMKPRDINTFTRTFRDLRIPYLIRGFNDGFESEYIRDEENMNTMEGERNAIMLIDGIKKFVTTLAYMDDTNTPGGKERLRQAVHKLLFGEDYLYSDDKKMLLLSIQPAISMDQWDETLIHLKVLRDKALKLKESRYPGLDVIMTGMGMIGLEEVEVMEKDSSLAAQIALIVIFLLLALSFRMWSAPLLAAISLLIGIIWTAGFIGFVLIYLNIYTIFFGVILIGLGVDYAIHVTSGYNEGRRKGLDARESIHWMYARVGKGVLTGALTTAIVFLSLNLIRMKAFYELGTICGVGILLCLTSIMIGLPALILLQNTIMQRFPRLMHRHTKKAARMVEFKVLRKLGVHIIRRPLLFSIGSLIATAFFIALIPRNYFEYDMMEMEPQDMPSVVLNNKIIDKFNQSPDYGLITTTSIEETYPVIKRLKRVNAFAGVDSIVDFAPSLKQQETSLPLVTNFRDELMKRPSPPLLTINDLEVFYEEMHRLSDNIIEMGIMANLSGLKRLEKKCESIVGDHEKGLPNRILGFLDTLKERGDSLLTYLNAFQEASEPYLRENLIRMANPEVITMDNIPDEIRDRYKSIDGSRFLTTIWSRGNVWDGKRMEVFNKKIKAIHEDATGSTVIFWEVMEILVKKGKQATVLALIVVFFLLLIDFHSLTKTITTLIPLIFGALWMMGLMVLFNIEWNFSNIMAVPLIVGIGIDDGVHMMHRYLIEGKGRLPYVLQYTGRAIILTSLTTMIGFGSLGLSSHWGIASFGLTLAVGTGSCLITSFIVLTSIMASMEKTNKFQITNSK